MTRLELALQDAKVELSSLAEKSNKAAAPRLRKAMQTIKAEAQTIRTAAQDFVNSLPKKGS